MVNVKDKLKIIEKLEKDGDRQDQVQNEKITEKIEKNANPTQVPKIPEKLKNKQDPKQK